jgi:hypothetical protein
LTPIHDALVKQSGLIDRKYMRFGSWPVQILTDGNPLVREAIREALEAEFEGVAKRVFRAVHLCAAALQTGRAKDYVRAMMFLEQNAVNPDSMNEVLQRYGLLDRLARVTE